MKMCIIIQKIEEMKFIYTQQSEREKKRKKKEMGWTYFNAWVTYIIEGK